jgi:hypothetical protein
MMDPRSIARALGGEVVGRNSILAPGPGHSRKDRSLSIKLDPNARDGFIVNSFAGDDPLTCRDYVRDQCGLPAWQPGDGQDRRVHHSHRKEFDRMAIDRDGEPRPRTDEEHERIARAVELWNKGHDPSGTIAEEYLRSRALDLPDDLAGNVLRFHPSCPWRNEDTGKTDHIPCLIAACRNIDADEITAIHRIRVDQPDRWPKAQRKMLGVVHRAAVKLAPIKEGTLFISEGIETGMAAQQLGYTPMWALGSVGAISFFPVLDGVKRLVIHRETGNPSGEATKICGRRWKHAGRKVQIIYSEIGSDLNDAIMKKVADGKRG